MPSSIRMSSTRIMSLIGSSRELPTFSSVRAAAASALARRSAARRASTAPPLHASDRAANGRNGNPGSSANSAASPEARNSGLAWPPSWEMNVLCAEPRTEPFDTSMPAPRLTISAGIWLTMPSPMVSVV